MKVLSSSDDPESVVTNAEVLEFLKEKRLKNRAYLPDGGGLIERGQTALICRLVEKYIRASPAGTQTVGSVMQLRDKVHDFGLAAEEFVQIVNMRADTDATLETMLREETAERLTDDQWEELRHLIDSTLEPRPVEDGPQENENIETEDGPSKDKQEDQPVAS